MKRELMGAAQDGIREDWNVFWQATLPLLLLGPRV